MTIMLVGFIMGLTLSTGLVVMLFALSWQIAARQKQNALAMRRANLTLLVLQRYSSSGVRCWREIRAARLRRW